MGVQCYWLEPIRKARLSLRRYSLGGDTVCPLNPGAPSYHNAQNPLFDVVETFEFSETYNHKLYTHEGPQERSDVPAEYQWPTHCPCGYEFLESDSWQVFSESLFRRADTGEILTQREFGPGAMYNAEWLADNQFMRGADGLALTVICPNGREWLIDGPCNNCTEPGTDHKCWCRSGTPPNITVSKDGCRTCSAGGGSIQAGDWHGWLRNGEFVQA